MNGRIQVFEVLRLVGQVHTFQFEVELLFNQGDPHTLGEGAPTPASTH